MNNGTVGVLGGGQLGRMLAESANRLNIRVMVLDNGQSAPAKQIIGGEHLDGSFKDRDAIQKLADKCDVLTIEIEHVDTTVLEAVAGSVAVEPHWQTIRTIQDKFGQKQHLEKHGVPMAAFAEVESTLQGLQAAAKKLGLPFMLKSKTEAYDGRGNYPVRSEVDMTDALKALANRPLYAEKWARFAMELAVMVVKTEKKVLSFPTVETVHEDSVCKLVYAPARGVTRAVSEKAQALARQAVGAFDGKGVFGVEMFLLEDDTVLVNEIAPRPHNSGHYTIEACPISQYDAHLRAILDLPIPEDSLRMRQPTIMLNILGGAEKDSHLAVAREALSVPGASVHLYGKGDARPGRKMGHVTVTAPFMGRAQTAIQPLIDFVDNIRAQRTDVPPPKEKPLEDRKPQAQIAMVMGSRTDEQTLLPAYDILTEDFGLSVDWHVTSAHRTPDVMREYARNAASHGIKVIIAAAGGAAHLPGMAAAQTLLPVCGVPVKGSSLDGMDSLYSILQMPRGTPVATFGIGNSTNAALFAARILGAFDDSIMALVEKKVMQAEDMAIESDRQLQLDLAARKTTKGT